MQMNATGLSELKKIPSDAEGAELQASFSWFTLSFLCALVIKNAAGFFCVDRNPNRAQI